MSIYKIFFQFFLTLFIGFILLINLDMYVSYITDFNDFLGANPMANYWNFETHYFGFRSLLNAFENLGDVCDVGAFVNAVNKLTYYLNTIPKALEEFLMSDISDWWTGFSKLAVAVTNSFASFLDTWSSAFRIICGFFYWLVLVVSGFYNTPIPIIS